MFFSVLLYGITHLWHIPCHTLFLTLYSWLLTHDFFPSDMRRFHHPVFSFLWQGGSNCPKRWIKLSDKVVQIIRQGSPNSLTEFSHPGNWTTFSGHFRLKLGGPNSPNKLSQFCGGSNSLTYSILGKLMVEYCCTGGRHRPSPNEAPPIGKIHPFS